MKVAINAQLERNSEAGGVASVLVALVSALGQLEDGPEEYIVIGPSTGYGWLEEFLGSNQRLVRPPHLAGHPDYKNSIV